MRSGEELAVPVEEVAPERCWQHEGLAVACSRRFFGRGIPVEELLQEARTAICLAEQRFDPSRGCCFSTYAVPVALGALRAYCRRWFQARVDRGETAALALMPAEDSGLVPAAGRCQRPELQLLVATRSFEERVLLRDAIRRLGDPYAQVIGLRYLCGLSQQEVGDKLNVAQWQVCRWEKIGIGRLREMWGVG